MADTQTIVHPFQQLADGVLDARIVPCVTNYHLGRSYAHKGVLLLDGANSDFSVDRILDNQWADREDTMWARGMHIVAQRRLSGNALSW